MRRRGRKTYEEKVKTYSKEQKEGKNGLWKGVRGMWSGLWEWMRGDVWVVERGKRDVECVYE